MLISTKGRYALRVMLMLSKQPKEEYLPLDIIAETENISEKYLESIVRILVKAKMIEGVRGRGGGYRLVKRPEEYSVGEIIRLTEGSLAPVSCLDCQPNPCSRAGSCKTLPVWQKLNTLINNYLDSVSLTDLMDDSEA